ncbi:hypothetical protein Scep_012638 [Stephania cephalantha]|uniref:Uncharacterized protein n=1 Tax=Stephania cephalantha TaxID=152367 RepID=A0AAP0JHH8_9MAGN
MDKIVLLLAPRLLEELMKMATIPRPPHGHGWLRPAIGTVELSQSIIQAAPFSARKASGGFAEGIAPFLQLPHFSESVIKKIARKHPQELLEGAGDGVGPMVVFSGLEVMENQLD